jgi:hypothetical protein
MRHQQRIAPETTVPVSPVLEVPLWNEVIVAAYLHDTLSLADVFMPPIHPTPHKAHYAESLCGE